MQYPHSFPEIVLFLLAVVIGCWFAFFGYVLVRLWYYKGALGPQPRRYVILPPYLRDKLILDTSEGSTSGLGDIPEQVHERRSHVRRDSVDDNTRDDVTRLPIISVNRWTSTAMLDPNVDIRGVKDESLKRELLEQKRISRMPHFVQDDCGDGRLFPEIPEIDPTLFNGAGQGGNDYIFGSVGVRDPGVGVSRRQPRAAGATANTAGALVQAGIELSTLSPSKYKPPPFRSDPPKNYRTMGLQKLDPSTWLLLDDTYTPLYSARSHLIAAKRSEVICTVSGGEAEAACEELMREVVAFLTATYPDKFDIMERSNGIKVVRNKIIGEEFRLQRPWDRHPLEVCARLAMEDFNILQRSEFTGEHRIIASATLFPAGWRLRERIGKSVTDLHGPVPLWKDLPDIVNTVIDASSPTSEYNNSNDTTNHSYFTRLTNSTSEKGTRNSMQRHTFFIQISPHAASTHPLSPIFPLSSLLFIQSGKDFFPGTMRNLSPACILIRRERQTFRRLPQSNTVVFTVKTSVERLVDLDEGQKRNLAKELRAWPSEVARYKGRDLWGKVVLGFCDEASEDDK